MSNLLLHSIAFSPDAVSTAYLYNDIALKLKDKGHTVVVLTTTPHYNAIEENLIKQPLFKKWFGLYYKSDYNGIEVFHITQKKFKNTYLRVMGFIYWHIMSFILGLGIRNIDIILSPSPPLSIGFINIVLAKIKGCKVIYNVQEIYPDLLIEAGNLKSKPIISLLKWLEKFVYDNSDKVITIDQVFHDTISDRFKDKSKLSIIPNFVDTDIFKPIAIEDLSTGYDIIPKNSTLKLMYAGNIGLAQDWELLVHLAEELIDESIDFYVIGEGVLKKQLELDISKKELKNIHLLPYQPREKMPSLIALADLQFIFMASQTDGHGFPSKIYTIMACAKPLIVSSGKNTPIINFLKSKRCAYLIENGDSITKAKRLADILRSISKDELRAMGLNGYSIIKEKYSRDVVTDEYLRLIETV